MWYRKNKANQLAQLGEHCAGGHGFQPWLDSQGGGGYSGINVTGGLTEPNILNPKKYMDLILCTKKNTRLELHADYLNHAFGSCGNFGSNCVRTITLAKFEP